MRSITWLFLLAPFVACTDKDTDDTDLGTDVDTDTDIDIDVDTDSDEDTDTDILDGTLRVTADIEDATSRTPVTFTVEHNPGDGWIDVTADADLVVTLVPGEVEVLRFFTSEPVAQALGNGTAEVIADLGGLVDSIEIDVVLDAAEAGDLVINEVLADGTVEGDPNGDGSLSATEDEFIEIANVSDVSVDLSGVEIFDADQAFLARHIFPDGTILRAGDAIVVFGGGDVSLLRNPDVRFQTATTTGGLDVGLALTDDGDTVTLKDANGVVIDTATWQAATTSDTSLVLQPELDGSAWSEHDDVETEAYSPGTLANGDDFGGPESVFGTP